MSGSLSKLGCKLQGNSICVIPGFLYISLIVPVSYGKPMLAMTPVQKETLAGKYKKERDRKRFVQSVSFLAKAHRQVQWQAGGLSFGGCNSSR